MNDPSRSTPTERSDGKPLVSLARATEFRDNLGLAKLNRSQLSSGPRRAGHIVIHDLRATSSP